MMKQAPGIIVTAEVSAATHTPAMPFRGVLFWTMQHQSWRRPPVVPGWDPSYCYPWIN